MSFEEKLIEKIKENDIIFNTKSKMYKNSIKKEYVWSKIADELGNSSNLFMQTDVLCITNFLFF